MKLESTLVLDSASTVVDQDFTQDNMLNAVVELVESIINTEAVIESALVIAPRTILVVSTDSEGNNIKLFEGLSSLTKLELKAEYGDNIFVYYQQLYTTVTGDQTYDMAVADEANYKKLSYSKEEFVEAFTNSFSDVCYEYISYSHKDLRKQQRVIANIVTAKKVSLIKAKNKVDTVQPNFALFFFTSLNQTTNQVFPIKGLSDIQISTAKEVLSSEDYYINEYQLLEGESESIKQQQESILFIVGTPEANDSYIKLSNLRWITQSEAGESVKGLIKNNIDPQTGVQVYLLRLNVWDKRQSDVFIHCNYKPFKSINPTK